jgi:hypothetical protein
LTASDSVVNFSLPVLAILSVVDKITPIIPIFPSFFVITIEFVYLFCIVGSKESSTLEITIGEFNVSKNGTAPSTPWSNSWLPIVYKNKF